MRQLWYSLFFIGIAFLLGCTETQPKFESLDGEIPQPTFSGSTTRMFPIIAYNASVSVTGECDMRVLNLEYSSNNGATWTDSGSAFRDCMDKTFSFTIPDASNLGFTASSPAGTQFQVLLRGKGPSDSVSKSSTMNVRFQSAEHDRLSGVTSGGGMMASTNYKIFGRIGAPVEAKVMSSTNYRIRRQEGN